jgi:hypothetical protein
MQKIPGKKLRGLIHTTPSQSLAWPLQVMCQRSALSPDAVAAEPLTRGAAAGEPEKPCRHFAVMAR